MLNFKQSKFYKMFKMRTTRYIFIILAVFALASCQNPDPVKLSPADNEEEQEKVDVEVIAAEPDVYVYENGYDSTGIVSPLVDPSSLISISLIKDTHDGKTVKSTMAQSVFYDKTWPVKLPNGKVISFKTATPGIISFNNVTARIQPLSVKFKYNSVLLDSLLGNYYLLFRKNGSGDNLSFQYNSKVRFKFWSFSGSEEFDIATPEEITGKVETSGSMGTGDVSFNLTWNTAGEDKVEIIIGIKNHEKNGTFPLYKLTAVDDGELKVPPVLFKNFPFDRQGKLVFTFIRKKTDEYKSLTLKDVYILAQSIHNIQVSIP